MPEPTATQLWLVVGLGNPGAEYENTRHNVGVMVIDTLAARAGGTLSRHKRANAMAWEGRVEGVRVILGRPRTYMNESGGPVAALAGFYDVDPAHVLVVHDELDIPFTTVRLKLGGGDNGHNGLRSVRRSLGTGDFHRLRVGIGRPPGRQDPADFVLSPFGTAERKELPLVREESADAVGTLLTGGLDRAQQTHHGRPATAQGVDQAAGRRP